MKPMNSRRILELGLIGLAIFLLPMNLTPNLFCGIIFRQVMTCPRNMQNIV